jgi:hypothetical protein
VISGELEGREEVGGGAGRVWFVKGGWFGEAERVEGEGGFGASKGLVGSR